MYCKNCGVELIKDAIYCQSCGCQAGSNPPIAGMNFQPNNYQIPNSYVKRKDPAGYIIVGIIITFMVVFVLFIYGDFEDNSNSYFKDYDYDSDYEYDYNDRYSDVTISKFTFKIPWEYETVYEHKNGINISTDDWYASIDIEKNSFEDLKEDKDYIRDYMEYYSYEVSNIEIKKYNSTELITAELKYEDEEIIFICAELDGEYVAIVMIANSDFTFDYSLINEIEPIISSAYIKSSDIQKL